jgi:hypothetical protein
VKSSIISGERMRGAVILDDGEYIGDASGRFV